MAGLSARFEAAWARAEMVTNAAVGHVETVVDDVLDRVRRHPILGEIYEVVDGSVGDYARDHGPMYAGALTFYTLLSLIPITVLFASVFGFILASGTDADVDAAVADVVLQLRKFIPYLQPSIANDLKLVIDNRSSLGIFGFLALLWSGAEVFRGVEFATARIFARLDHAPVDAEKVSVGNLLKTRLLFGAVATAAVVVVVLLRISAGILRQVLDVIHAPHELVALVADPLGDSGWTSRLFTAIGLVVGFWVLTKVFTPHDVRSRFAIAGGVLFSALFHLARLAYGLYLDSFTNLGAMYGGFATAAVVVLWVYFCATLLLFCFHLTKVLQRRLTVGPRWPKDGGLLFSKRNED